MRFPEFTGEWQKYSLGEIGETIIGLTYKPSDVVENNGTIVFRSSNIKNGEIDYSDLVRVNKPIKDRIITTENDILVCARNGSQRLIGKNAIIKKEDANNTFGAFMMVYRSNENSFIRPLLSTKRYFSQVGENLGARINQITTSDFNGFEFYFPDNHIERTKIAKLFRLIDDRIVSQNKIIEKLESLIRGLCLKLVSQGIPNTTLNTCLECHSSILQEKSVTTDGKYPVYGAAGICGYSDTPEASGDSILIIKDGASVGATFYVSGKYSAIGTLNRLTARPGCSLRYLYYCLKIFDFSQYKTGQAIPHIYFRDYGIAKIWCPSLAQQEHIAGILTSIDTKIQMERSLLEHLTIQKRFLLRNMFI
ncbi:restriction endonuclease subunit S [Alistipes finegoldii]|uniref:restriction endonuclease subunit S n=1 Tax=Alistipes finegoldii TaxID=214856 RepID=UPI003A9136D9